MRTILICCFLFSFGSIAVADTFAVDGAHSSVVFKINHLGFGHVYGQFGDISGDFTLDDKNPQKSSMNLKIKAESIDTHVAKRDQHLRSPDFFNVKKNPWITFASTSVSKGSGETYKVSGNLTMNGVTKPLNLTVTRNRTGVDQMGATRTGGDTNFKIKRSDFGIKYGLGENGIGDEVELMVSIEGTKK